MVDSKDLSCDQALNQHIAKFKFTNHYIYYVNSTSRGSGPVSTVYLIVLRMF